MQLAGRRLLLRHCAFIASTENQQKIIRRRAHIRYGREEEVDGKWEVTDGQRGQAELGPVCSAILQARNR